MKRHRTALSKWFIRGVRRILGTEGLAARNEASHARLEDAIANLSAALAAMNLPREVVVDSAPYVRAAELLSLLTPMDVQGLDFVRVGNARDGGYVMLDDFGTSGPRIAYSFGINRDVTWDRDMASRAFDVYMYDHTIDALPENNPRFHFHRQGITGAIKAPAMCTLEDLVAKNGHEEHKEMILKLDVEGAEWDVLSHCTPAILSRFSQIVLEIHGLREAVGSEKFYMVRSALRNLAATHQPVHVHGNNYTAAIILPGIVLPTCIEASFASREIYGDRLTKSKRVFPTSQDAANCGSRCDIMLGDAGRSADQCG